MASDTGLDGTGRLESGTLTVVEHPPKVLGHDLQLQASCSYSGCAWIIL